MCWYSVTFIVILFFFFKQKTAYEMRISDWSSDVCSSDLVVHAWGLDVRRLHVVARRNMRANCKSLIQRRFPAADTVRPDTRSVRADAFPVVPRSCSSAPWARWLCRGAIAPMRRSCKACCRAPFTRSEEHTSELQSLMRTSYAV